MAETQDISISYDAELHPVDTNTTRQFLTELGEYTHDIYTSRKELYQNNKPLLATVDTPRYNQTTLPQLIAYGIDMRNIQEWKQVFLGNTTELPTTPNTIKFTVSPEDYEQTDTSILIPTENGTVEFEFETQSLLHLDDAVLNFKYTPHKGHMSFSVKESTETTDETGFTTAYDICHSKLNGYTVDKNEVFAVYSPATDYETVEKHATQQTDSLTILVTEDNWKVCIRSPEAVKFSVASTVVELLNSVSDEIVEYYNTFTYPTRYINIPELQFLHTHGNDYFNEREQKELRTLPYAVPYGSHQLLSEKLVNAQKFVNESVNIDTLESEQFLTQDTKEL